LFKGKRVAVIGGGNSGVEAAIDLAGVVQHVDLVEFADALKADAVLVNKLRACPTCASTCNAQTTEITGDGQKVNGLRYRDRSTPAGAGAGAGGCFRADRPGAQHRVPQGHPGAQQVRRDRGGCERPHQPARRVFAAGDVTTVPYKQIVIAAGDGAKAALSAFDYLIRTPLVTPQAAVAA
jgi:alkyl hydroperoxide reductase subunit F